MAADDINGYLRHDGDFYLIPRRLDAEHYRATNATREADMADNTVRDGASHHDTVVISAEHERRLTDEVEASGLSRDRIYAIALSMYFLHNGVRRPQHKK